MGGDHVRGLSSYRRQRLATHTLLFEDLLGSLHKERLSRKKSGRIGGFLVYNMRYSAVTSPAVGLQIVFMHNNFLHSFFLRYM